MKTCKSQLRGEGMMRRAGARIRDEQLFRLMFVWRKAQTTEKAKQLAEGMFRRVGGQIRHRELILCWVPLCQNYNRGILGMWRRRAKEIQAEFAAYKLVTRKALDKLDRRNYLLRRAIENVVLSRVGKKLQQWYKNYSQRVVHRIQTRWSPSNDENEVIIDEVEELLDDTSGQGRWQHKSKHGPGTNRSNVSNVSKWKTRMKQL